MARRQIVTWNSEETIACGREIGARLKAPVLILLSGELGAGKTTLTKGIVSGFGAAPEDEVTSPTFTLVHKYGQGVPVYHVDLYRVEDARDFSTLGIEDIFREDAVVLIEWAEKFALPSDWSVFRIHLEHVSPDARRVTIEEGGDARKDV